MGLNKTLSTSFSSVSLWYFNVSLRKFQITCLAHKFGMHYHSIGQCCYRNWNLKSIFARDRKIDLSESWSVISNKIYLLFWNIPSIFNLFEWNVIFWSNEVFLSRRFQTWIADYILWESNHWYILSKTVFTCAVDRLMLRTQFWDKRLVTGRQARNVLRAATSAVQCMALR